MARPSWSATGWQRQGGRGQKVKLINFKLDPLTFRCIFFGLIPGQANLHIYAMSLPHACCLPPVLPYTMAFH